MENKLFLISCLRRALIVAGLGCVSVCGMRAAEKIRWEDLQQHPSRIQHRRADVYTLDGKKHEGIELALVGDSLKVYALDGRSTETLSRKDIQRIEVSRPRRFARTIARGAELPFVVACDQAEQRHPRGCSPVAFVATTPVWAFTAATAPLFLLGDGVRRLAGPAVFEILH